MGIDSKKGYTMSLEKVVMALESSEEDVFVIWRANNNCVPVDEVVQTIGVLLASKCNCCAGPSVKTLGNVLCSGELANKVWDYFKLHHNIDFTYVHSWKNRMSLWWWKESSTSQIGILHGIALIAINWALWKTRCEARMEGLILH